MSIDRDGWASSRWVDVDARRELLRAVAGQEGVTALGLDQANALCALHPEILELGVGTFGEDDDGERASVPFALIHDGDQPGVIASLLRARSHGAADAIVHRKGCDEELVVHVVDMLDEWGMVVILVGGVLRPLLEHGAGVPERTLPRRLIHHRDLAGRVLWVDDATELLLGWTREEMVGQSAVKFIDPADHQRGMATWAEMLAGGRIERSRIRYLTAAGDRRWFEVTVTNIGADSDAGYVEVELIDVHDEMMALSAAKFGEAQFEALTESLPVGVIQLGANGEVAYVNRWMRDLTGVAVRGGTCRDGVVADDHELVEHAFAAAISTGSSSNVDVRLISASDGQHRHCRLRIRALRTDEDGRSLGAIGSIEDVTEARALHARLYEQIRTDSLTGVANRLALNEWLVEHLLDGVGAGVTLLYFDLDGFKRVNDRLGHEAGDRLLRSLAMAIYRAIGPNDFIARIGGDEFVVARPELMDDDRCARLAQHLLDIVECDIELGDATVRVGCSIGIARTVMPDGGSTVLSDADHAMYHSKRNGGHRWTFHTEALESIDDDAFPRTPSDHQSVGA